MLSSRPTGRWDNSAFHRLVNCLGRILQPNALPNCARQASRLVTLMMPVWLRLKMHQACRDDGPKMRMCERLVMDALATEISK
jgi:hypothetical protein